VTDLKEYGDLRNAIVHDGFGGQPIAEPHDETVAKLEAILEKLRDPPKLVPAFNVPVVTCEVAQPVGHAAKAMLDGGFSQLPVYENGTFRELLTAETIARWLGDKLANGDEFVLEEPIGDVVAYTEDSEHLVFVSRKATVFDALNHFDAFARRGKYLDAILISHTGAQNEKLLGIITTYDIPRLHAAADVRPALPDTPTRSSGRRTRR
jgi:CBS domain-containing protein